MKFSNLVKNRTLRTLFLLIALAAILRLYNLNWDQGGMFHPDERNIANAVTKIHFFNQLNPYFFAYGGFSIYLYRLTADLLTGITNNISWIMNWGSVDVVGRFFSALFSVLTIIPLFFLTKKIINEKVAFLTIFLYVFLVSSIQTAHFAVTESLITLIGVLSAYISLFLDKQAGKKYWIILGVTLGIGLASKTTAISFFIFPFTAMLFAFFKKPLRRKELFVNCIIMGLVSCAIFLLFSPYSILDFKDFSASMIYENGVATGTLPVPYTLQFTGSIPYLFQLLNFFWQMGPVAIFTVPAYIFFLWEAFKHKKSQYFILLSFPTVYFLYVGSWHTKFIRYMVPLLPFILIYISFLLEWLKERLKYFNIVIFIFCLSSLLWTLAFFSIYTAPQTRVLASTWIYQNIPYGSKLLTEQWDDGLPISIDQFSPSLYNSDQLALYGTDDPQKLNYLIAELQSTDYVVINSRRLYGTLMRLTQEYPYTSNYYKLLFSGKLGFKKIAEFSSYPTLFGIVINDDKSEETFQVYDHPKVMIFKKVVAIPSSQMLEYFNSK